MKSRIYNRNVSVSKEILSTLDFIRNIKNNVVACRMSMTARISVISDCEIGSGSRSLYVCVSHRKVCKSVYWKMTNSYECLKHCFGILLGIKKQNNKSEVQVLRVPNPEGNNNDPRGNPQTKLFSPLLP